ncbi:F-actin-uncapping protein LRRC16A-like [Lingula anatina]|uniref:F-actin-uncapping protein LRRC16A-like n=1 Tax=Lingula anatina TaxID=7574 RepID=A0A1S3I9M1_LINAN|nr:F-actin-uncapping protein LRRC16A-like [Lingula anatina]|eukprot:XP_013394965.1 F-actin-uncapping protein LRRC16A-like [Lingula anatina]
MSLDALFLYQEDYVYGNSMGDFGARMLAKALQINTKLTALVWDKNNTTVQGFEDIAAALQKNYTVRKMPAPFHDAAAALKVTPDRTEKALQTIERLLQRNHSPRKFASEQAFRLQQGFLISSTQQMVDKLVVHLQDTINALNMSSSDEFRADIESGQQYITDADNSKQLLPKLQEIALSQEAEGNPVQAKLQSITQELGDLVEEQMKGTVSEMLSCAKEQCPGVLDSETVKEELEEGSTERSQFPKDFTKILIMDQVGTDVLNKISELNLSVAAYISDRMVDQVIEALGTTQKTLTNHLNTRKSLQRALPEKVQQEEKQDGESSEKEQFTIDREEKEKPSPGLLLFPTWPAWGDSPKVRSKRQSMYMRKMRPQSVVDLETLPLESFEVGRLSAPRQPVEDFESVSSLESAPHRDRRERPLSNLSRSSFHLEESETDLLGDLIQTLKAQSASDDLRRQSAYLLMKGDRNIAKETLKDASKAVSRKSSAEMNSGIEEEEKEDENRNPWRNDAESEVHIESDVELDKAALQLHPQAETFSKTAGSRVMVNVNGIARDCDADKKLAERSKEEEITKMTTSVNVEQPPPSEDKPKDAKEAPQPVPAPRTRSAARASRLAAEKNAEEAASEAKSPAHPSTTVPTTSTTATTAPSSSTAAVTTTTTTTTTTTSVREETTPAVKVSSAQQSPVKVPSTPSPAKAESSSSKPHPTAVKAEKDSTDGPSPKQPMKPKPLLRPKPPPVAPKPKPKPRPKAGSMTPEGSPAGKDASGTKEEESTSRPSSMLEDNEDHAENSEESPGKDQILGGSSSTEDLADKTGHSSEESLPTDVMARSRSLHGNLASTPAAERQQKTRSLFSALSKEMESQFQKKEDQPHAFKGRNSGANDAVATQEESSALNLGGSTKQDKPSRATIEDKPSGDVVPEDSSLKQKQQQQEHISDLKAEKSDKSEEHVTPPPFDGKTSEGGASTDEFEFVDEEDVVMV